MRLQVSCFSIVAALFAWMPEVALADGMYIPPADEAAMALDDITSPDQHVILIDRGETQEMVVRVRVVGAPEKFAWLMPLPAAPSEPPVELEKGDMLFRYLIEGSGPEWRDEGGGGCGCVATPTSGGSDKSEGLDGDGSVDLLGSALVGSFELSTLAAASAPDLSAWLLDNGYKVPDGFELLAKPYLDDDWVFVAVKLHVPEPEEDQRLSVLHFKWKGDKPVFPMRMTAGNADPGGTKVHLIVFSDHRMTVKGMGSAFAGLYPADYQYSWWTEEFDYEVEYDSPEQLLLDSLTGMWWTRLEGTFSSADMNADLYPTPAKQDVKFREKRLYSKNSRSDRAATFFALAALLVAALSVIKLASGRFTDNG